MKVQCKTWRWKEMKTVSKSQCRIVANDYKKRPWAYRTPGVLFNDIVCQLMLAGF